jgi:hypothetical protein
VGASYGHAHDFPIPASSAMIAASLPSWLLGTPSKISA